MIDFSILFQCLFSCLLNAAAWNLLTREVRIEDQCYWDTWKNEFKLKQGYYRVKVLEQKQGEKEGESKVKSERMIQIRPLGFCSVRAVLSELYREGRDTALIRVGSQAETGRAGDPLSPQGMSGDPQVLVRRLLNVLSETIFCCSWSQGKTVCQYRENT